MMRARLLQFPRLGAPVPRVGPAAREGVAAVCVVVALGGIPGGASRSVALDLSAPPQIDEDAERDAAMVVNVRDGADGSPTPHARVRALAMRQDQAYLAGAAETDGVGEVHFAHLPRGEVWILADAPKHARGSSHVVLGSQPRNIQIDLVQEHALDVVVTDDQGAPVANAQIEAYASDEPLPVGARTGQSGFARITRLGAGPWTVTAGAPSYEEVTGRAKEGETAKFSLRKLAALTVRVIGPDDQPVAGARVLAAGASLWPARAAETSPDGEVRLGGLVAGAYALRASRGDLVSPIEFEVTLSRGEEKPLLLRLSAGTSVGVRVTDGSAEDGPPVAGARVLLVEGGLSPFPLEAKTDAHGRARLGPVAPGSATLGVSAEGFVPRGAVPVPDPVPTETRLALVRSGTLTGRVTDARGYPIAGATIEIVGNDPNGAPILDDPRRASFQAAHFDALLSGPAPFAASGELGVVPGPVPPIPLSSRFPANGFSPAPALPRERPSLAAEPWVTRGDGTFRASPASPGRVRAIVRHPQYVEAQSQMVTLVPGGEAQVEIILREGGSLEGRVVDDEDRPAQGARVFVAAAQGTLERMTRTASDGTFAFGALPETITLTVSADDEHPDIRLELAIPEGERREVTLRLPATRPALGVTVVDDRNRAVAGVQLSASSLDVELPLRTTAFTDARGEAVLKRAAGVPVRIEATAPRYAPSVVSTNGTAEIVRIALAPAESVTGEVVVARSGDPISKAEVSLSTEVGVRRSRTDVRGQFAIAGLAPGLATLRVRAPTFAPISTTISIPENGGRRPFPVPRVELTSEGRVEGEVIDARGDPVPGARVAKDHVPTWLLVGTNPRGIAIADAKGRFSLGELPDGTTALEAYAPDVGHARADGIRVVGGTTTVGVRLVLGGIASEDSTPNAPAASGSVAITLGETNSPEQVVVVSVVEGSEAERAGLIADDVLLAVNAVPVRTIEEARAKLSGPAADDVVLRVRRADRTLTMRVAREAVRR